MSKTVFAFGRMNPPTVGHEKLAKKVSDEARKRKAMPHIYLSHSQDKKKNPLSYNDKIKYASRAFGKMVTKSSSKTIIQVMQDLQKMGHTEVVLIAGSDRVQEFKVFLNKYNGKDYTFDTIEVVSAGERDPDAEGVEGMSGTKLRGLAQSGDFDQFKTGLASKLNDNDKKKIYNIIRSVVEEVSPKQLSDLEKFGDRILAKFSVDITFSRHFADRMNDARNKPEIKIAELQALFKKIAKKKAVDIKKYPNAEVVLKDIQKDLNLPIAIKVDKDGTLEVVHKTIMRKKNFGTPDPVISYESLEEGVNDPGIFKAVFLAGGPGSGKSFIVGNTGLVSLGLKVVNVDDVFERALKKAGLDTTPEDIFSPKGQEIRGKASTTTKNRHEGYLKGRLGLVLDGTGKDYNKIATHAKELKKLGYEVAMIFVNTDLDTALVRNKERKRTLPDDQVTTMWKDVQKNLGKFQNYFGANFTIVDNSKGIDSKSITLATYKKISKWVKISPSSKTAKNWISQEKSRRDIVDNWEPGELSGQLNTFFESFISESYPEENDDIPEFSDKDLDDIYDELMADEEDYEWDEDTDVSVEDEDTDVSEAVLTLQQRMKKRLLMRRLGPLIARKRKIALRRKANKHQLQKRARKAAVMLLKKRVAGNKGANYKSLKPSEKISIDRLVSKKMGMVPAIARRLLPMITKKEMQRFASLNKNKNEEFTNYLDELYFKVDVEGLPSVYIEAPSAGTIKSDLRKLIRNPGENIHSIDRVGRGEIVKAFRLRAQNPSDPLEVDEDLNEVFEVYLEEKTIEGLKNKAEKSGISYGILKKVYDRGMGAYKNSHRPGTTPQQWAFARVNSFMSGGKTQKTTDSDLWAKVKKESVEEGKTAFKKDKKIPNLIVKTKTTDFEFSQYLNKNTGRRVDYFKTLKDIRKEDTVDEKFSMYVIEKESNVEIVRARHRKERKASKREFDSELDAARLRDTRITNNKNEEFEALIAERQDINQD